MSTAGCPGSIAWCSGSHDPVTLSSATCERIPSTGYVGRSTISCTTRPPVACCCSLEPWSPWCWPIPLGARRITTCGKYRWDWYLGGYRLERSLHHWVNDGLMALFFFVVGLELKREVVGGELSDPRKALLPVAAGFGDDHASAALHAAQSPRLIHRQRLGCAHGHGHRLRARYHGAAGQQGACGAQGLCLTTVAITTTWAACW